MRPESLAVHQAGLFGQRDASQGFNPYGAMYTFPPQDFTSFGAQLIPFEPALHNNVPEHVLPVPHQWSSSLSGSFDEAASPLGPVLPEGSPSDVQANGTKDTDTTARIVGCGHNRRARGEARRGQPRPSRWTADEERTLTQMYAQRKDTEQSSEIASRVAEMLGKSTVAVEAKHWRLLGGEPKAYKKKRGHRGGPQGGT